MAFISKSNWKRIKLFLINSILNKFLLVIFIFIVYLINFENNDTVTSNMLNQRVYYLSENLYNSFKKVK